jgi:adenylate cyclase
LASTILDEALHGAALHEVGNIQNSPYSEELNNAYLWAFFNDITTMNTIQKANMEGTLIRKDMAKMISNFAVNVLKRTPSTGINCAFSDTKGLTEEAKTYITLSCKLGLM